MYAYLARRLALALLTLLMITFVVYAIIRHIPGTPLTTDPGTMSVGRTVGPEQLAQLNKLYGLDKPWYQAYFVWLGNVVRLDLGRSIPQNNRPVTALIYERMPATLMLSATSLILSYLLSIPIGLWATMRRS